MECVYVYIDKNDRTVKYVGRAKSPSRMAARIADHKRDAWYKTGDWEIRYAGVDCRAASEALETELINIYSPQFNKDKKGWGRIGVETGDIFKDFVILPEWAKGNLWAFGQIVEERAEWSSVTKWVKA